MALGPIHKENFLKVNFNLWVSLFLFLAILAVYWQTSHFEFTSFDDDLYVTANRYVQSGLSKESIQWAFNFADKQNTYWHPLTWLSHMLDVEIYGLNPGGHHFSNVLFHIANSLLLFWLLQRMSAALWCSAFVAAMFALHPVNVESVAWVSERKNVLSTFFWMLTLMAYARYCERSNLARYLLVVLVFALGLLAKPMLVTLPFVLLLLDYWPLERFSFKGDWPGRLLRLILEKAPLLILSALLIYLASLSVQGLGIIKSIEALPMSLRIENALVSYVKYIFKMLWPVNLAVFYPYPQSVAAWQFIGALAVLSAISIGVILLAKRQRYLAVGWFWYLGTLVPVIGLVQAGLWPELADRWAYVPLIGLFVMIAWGGMKAVSRWQYRKIVMLSAAGVILFLMMVISHIQNTFWASSVDLYAHAIESAGSSWITHNNLGNALRDLGRADEALKHYALSLKQQPPDPEGVYFNMAIAHASAGRLNEAITNYSEALKLNAEFVAAHINLGAALAEQKRIDEALWHYNEALRLDPTSVQAQINYGNSLLAIGKVDEAARFFSNALRATPQVAEYHNSLGVADIRKGNFTNAIFHFQTALNLKPDYDDARRNFKLASVNHERIKRTVDMMRKAMSFRSDDPNLSSKIKDLLEIKKELEQAVRKFEKSVSLQPGINPIDSDQITLVHEIKKEYEEKLPLFKKISTRWPDWAATDYHIACIYSRQGQIVESIKWLEQAIRKGFDDRELLKTDNDLKNVRSSSYYARLIKN